MKCPQCGAEVPSDDAFCGKCGYARRDQTPDRLDQSRIRVHETPDPSSEDGPRRSISQKRVRKHTVLGMPAGTPPAGFPAAAAPEPAPATPAPPAARPEASAARTPRRTPQKTMLGIQPEFVSSHGGETYADPHEPGSVHDPERASGPVASASTSHRARARVRYDSANEPLPVVQRRKNALRGLAVLVVLSAAWLAYRYVSLHG